MAPKCCTKPCVIISAVVGLILLILFSLSFSIIEPNEMAIALNDNIQKLYFDEWYDNGRYLLGLGISFVKFPRTYQSVRFGSTFDSKLRNGGDVVVRSYDGLPMTVEFAFTYLMTQDPEELARIYLDFEEDRSLMIENVALECARDVASRFLAFSIFSSRDAFIEDMGKELNTRLKKYYITVPSFELANFEVAERFSTAIEQTQVARQDVSQATFEREVARVDAERERDVAIELARVQILAANYTARRIIAEEEAVADALVYTVARQALASKAIRTEIGLGSNDDLLKYTLTAAVQDSKAQQVTLQQDMPDVFQIA